MELRIVEEPGLPPSLEELDQEHWEILNMLYYHNRPVAVDEEPRAELERHGLLDGTKLTELGEFAHNRMHRYLSPWDYSKDGKTWKSCAVVASDGKGNDVLLQAFGPAIDWHLDQYGNDIEMLDLEAPDPGVWVWEGSMGSEKVSYPEVGDEYEHRACGSWRAPTREEWVLIRNEECPWTKDSLPRWEKEND